MKRNPVTEDDKKENEDIEDEDEEMEDEEKSSKKSEDLTEDDLMKSINKLESFATEEDPNARKNALLDKAQNEDLDKSEQDELISLISGEVETETEEPISKGFVENEVIQKSLDVSDFLTEHTHELTKSLDLIGNNINKSDNAQHEFNLMLARAVTNVGKLVKSVADKLEVIGEQPVRKPTSTQPLNKSFAGTDSKDEQRLSKGEVLDRITTLVSDSFEKGGNGYTDFGVDLTNEAAKFEMTGVLDPRVLKLVESNTVN